MKKKRNNTGLKLQFLGGAGTVTGSKYLLEAGDIRILIDCGLFQGIKKLRLLNREDLPVPPSDIKYVLLTHAHLDHCGYIPRLVMKGFEGKILGTAPTLRLTDIILHDSAKVQEEETKEANERGYSRHRPAKPLYITRDVENSLRYFEAVKVNEWIDLEENIRCRFIPNGHILGSTFIEMEANGKKIVFSGDIGREKDPLLYPPQKPVEADVVLLESTYGDRLHPRTDVLNELDGILRRVKEEEGVLVIPSFAVERAQVLLYLFSELRKANKLYGLPVYMDSPMSSKVVEAFTLFHNWHRIPEAGWADIFRGVNIVGSYEESMKLIKSGHSRIVVAGSGMITGGRVLGYLEQYISDPKATVLLVGFQAEGTRGRQLLEGAQEIRIHGNYYPVKAQIKCISGLSAHADQQELTDWLDGLGKSPEQVFLVHGEPGASDCLRVRLKARYGWEAVIPSLNETYDIG